MIQFLKKFFNEKLTKTQIESGETEYDYINPEELKLKKKKNPKQFDGVDSPDKFVKTRKKK